MIRVTSIFASLEGKWTLSRIIPGHGTIKGFANFVKKSSKELHYREDGIFQKKEGDTFKVFREYIYSLENDTISVHFAEIPKRLFQTLQFSEVNGSPFPTTTKTSHLCKCDTYDAIYAFADKDNFTISYDVKGPEKNYSINTIYKRCLN